MKDERYLAVKRLIDNEDITRLDQCFKIIPKTVVAIDLKAHQGRFSTLLNNVDRITVGEIFGLSNLFDVDDAKIYKLISNQFSAEKNRTPKKNNRP